MRIGRRGAVTVLALTLVACGGSNSGSSTPEETSEVTVWMYPVINDEDASREFWAKVESDFEDQNQGIDVTIDLQPFDTRDEKVAAAIAAGDGPDLVLLTPDQTLQYQVIGGLLPVDDAIEDREAFYPATLDVVTFDDHLYGVPFFHNSTTTVYNTKLFEDAGISDLPTSWDEVLDAAPKLAAQGIAVMDYAGSPELTLNNSFYPILWQAGGTIFTANGSDVAFDSPEGESALQFLLDLQEMGGLPPDVVTKRNNVEGGPLATEAAAMSPTVTMTQVGEMRAAVGDENVEVGPPLIGTEQVTFGNPGMLTRTKMNQDEDAAIAFARYLTSPDVMHELNVASGTFPTRSDVEPPSDDPTTQAFADAIAYANPGEVTSASRQVMAALAPQVQAALNGDKTARQALDDAAAEARDIIARAG